MKHCQWRTRLFVLLLFAGQATFAGLAEYELVIDREPIHIAGETLKKITVNGSIPGPTLVFTEGDDAVIRVTNRMKENTSVHWHGLLLPGTMDGVPGFNGFSGISQGETFTYRFTIRQHGTYWYHAHSMGQEQDGLYGALVIRPRHGPEVPAERDYVVLISDFHKEDSNEIIANLKMSPDYYQIERPTVGEFFANVEKKGFAKAWQEKVAWGEMRMLPTDLSDVTGYTFLVNGLTPGQNWTGLFQAGERIRLRFINASAMSFYDVRIPGLKMSIVSADGQLVEPVEVDEFRFGVAETYDLIVIPKDNKAYTIVAEAVDRSGFALGTLAPREDMHGTPPHKRPRARLTMADMGMENDGGGAHAHHHTKPAEKGKVLASGWSNAGTPKGHKALDYADLRYRSLQKDQRQPEREIVVRLGGNMERYTWTMNGKKFEDSEPVNLENNERVRLKFINETMMAHPMHLHGMFVQLENGQAVGKLPNKHTVIVAPGKSYSTLLTANEPGEWAFHCHLLFHMMSGMMDKVVVARRVDSDLSAQSIRH